jgi:hypothetical protein
MKEDQGENRGFFPFNDTHSRTHKKELLTV